MSNDLHHEATLAAATLEQVAETLEHVDQHNQARECRKRAEKLSDAPPDLCAVCGEPIPEDYGKWDTTAPVYADDFVYHMGCEAEVFEEVYAEV